MVINPPEPPFEAIITHIERETQTYGEFDPHNMHDARQHIATSILARRGQAAFRKQLLEAYQGRCAITGCDVVAVLEAAHTIPYQGAETNHPSNGLLLRADLHTLFDVGLLTIDPDTMTVRRAPELRHSDYGTLEGRLVRLPVETGTMPSRAALHVHRQRYFVGV